MSCSPRARAFSNSPSSRMTSMVATAAAQATALPPYVPPCAPTFQRAIRSARAAMPLNGKPEAIPLAMTRMSGSTPLCSSANQRPVRPKPVCTSSMMSRMP